MAGKNLIKAEGMNPSELDFSNFADATKETYNAILDKDFVPSTPRTYKILKEKLQSYQEKFPQVYQKMLIDPLIAYMDSKGQATVPEMEKRAIMRFSRGRYFSGAATWTK